MLSHTDYLLRHTKDRVAHLQAEADQRQLAREAREESAAKVEPGPPASAKRPLPRLAPIHLP